MPTKSKPSTKAPAAPKSAIRNPKSALPKKPANLASLALGKRDIFKLARKNITTAPGFNARTTFTGIPELAASIVANGQKQPLRGHMENGVFLVTDGERRLRAIDHAIENGAKIPEILVIPESQGYTTEQRALDLLICNDGVPLSMLEQATAFSRLRDDHKWDVKRIATQAGKTQQHVYDCLKLLEAPEEIRTAVAEGKLSPSLAVTITKEATSPEEAVATMRDGLSTAEADGKSKITERHVPTRRNKGRSSGDSGRSKGVKIRERKETDPIAQAKAEQDAAELRKRLHEEATSAVDSVAKLRELLAAVPRSRSDVNRYDALEFLIDYLLGNKDLPEAITFFKE